jgi:uncharacterized membrane protein required for colicin V production
MTRAIIIDALALAMLFALAIVAYHLLPGAAYAAFEVRPAPENTTTHAMAGLFIAGLILVCIGFAGLAHIASRFVSGPKSTADFAGENVDGDHH